MFRARITRGTGITDDVGSYDVSYPMGPGVTGNVEVSNPMGPIEAAIEVAIDAKAEAVVKMRMSQMSMVNPSQMEEVYESHEDDKGLELAKDKRRNSKNYKP